MFVRGQIMQMHVSLTQMQTFGREHTESGYEFLVDLKAANLVIEVCFCESI